MFCVLVEIVFVYLCKNGFCFGKFWYIGNNNLIVCLLFCNIVGIKFCMIKLGCWVNFFFVIDIEFDVFVCFVLGWVLGFGWVIWKCLVKLFLGLVIFFFCGCIIFVCVKEVRFRLKIVNIIEWESFIDIFFI